MGEPGGEGKGEKMNRMRKRKNDERKNEKAKGGKKKRGGGGGGGGGSFKKKKRKGREENERRGGEILDTYRSIKLDSIDIKFRYLVLLNTRNLLMVFDKNFNS